MTLSDLQREVASLPQLVVDEMPEGNAERTPTLVEVASRQGKLILRLSATTEALEGRLRDLAGRLNERDTRAETLSTELTTLRQDTERQIQESVQQTRQLARETIYALDALDWVQDVLEGREDALAGDVARARADCMKRLATVGVTEIRAEGVPDGRFHESVDTVDTDVVPQYHIVSVVRRGYQWGAEVLRRTEVVTAA